MMMTMMMINDSIILILKMTTKVRMVAMLMTTKIKMTKVTMTRRKMMVFKDDSLGFDTIW